MLVTELGIVTLTRRVQARKTASLMLVIEAGIVTLTRLTQR